MNQSVMQNSELQQAEKDLRSLRNLKKEADTCTVLCPNCETRGLTKTEQQTSVAQYAICLLLYTFGCELGCCLIPFCCNQCKDTVHKCGSCGAILGVKRMIWARRMNGS